MNAGDALKFYNRKQGIHRDQNFAPAPIATF